MKSAKTENTTSCLAAICGGIAVYKTVEVVSKLHQADWDVHVAMSAAARQFVTPMTFAAVTGKRGLTEMFPNVAEADGEAPYPHIYPASEVDVFLLLPATADMIARIALGLADDIVCASALALKRECRRVFCPAMNSNMWAQPAVQRNVERLVRDGWEQLGPAEGRMACGTTGAGRMLEPTEILSALT